MREIAVGVVTGGPLRVVAGLIDRPPLSVIALPEYRTFGVPPDELDPAAVAVDHSYLT